MHKILVVDDDEGMRIALVEALSRAGFQPTCCIDGHEGVAQLKKAHWSMVITDIKMPGMSGLELLRVAKTIAPDTPVVMITAYGTVDNAVEAMKDGACDYLLKPFSFENLIAIVRNGLAQAEAVRAGTADEAVTPASSSQETRKIVTADPKMLSLLDMARSIARSNATVLIYGESGTGKELIAHLMHVHSHRSDKPFVAVNCAAIPDNLLESELFGHEKGSFTGAAFRKYGKFELAQGGTILLDEIGEMSMTLQAKLLRVLQEFEIDRVGGKEPVPIDVRVISTTNIDLRKAVSENKFREDLYYRLNVIPIKVPPLRDRPGDVELLTKHFMDLHVRRNGRDTPCIDHETVRILAERPWKGNVRELQNTIERAVLLCRDNIIRPGDLVLEDAGEVPVTCENMPTTTIEEMERRLIARTLTQTRGNRTHAAKSLGISIRTLRNKLKEYREKDLVINGA